MKYAAARFGVGVVELEIVVRVVDGWVVARIARLLHGATADFVLLEEEAEVRAIDSRGPRSARLDTLPADFSSKADKERRSNARKASFLASMQFSSSRTLPTQRAVVSDSIAEGVMVSTFLPIFWA